MTKFKIFIVSIIAFIAMIGTSTSNAASIIKGENVIGISAGYVSHNESCYTSIFYQYTIIPHLRISPELGYAFRHKDQSAFLINLDVHVPYRIWKAINIYPIAGFTFQSWQITDNNNFNRIGGNLGGGLEMYLTSNLKINFQAKYSFVKDASSAFVGLGIGYVF